MYLRSESAQVVSPGHAQTQPMRCTPKAGDLVNKLISHTCARVPAGIGDTLTALHRHQAS